MRARNWSSMVVLTTVIVGGGMATLPNRVKAAGKKEHKMVVVTKTLVNGIAVSFIAKGALGSARFDGAGNALEEIGCWTYDGATVNCQAVDNFGVQAACIVADFVSGGVSLGYMTRLAAINGDSYIQFSAQADDPTDSLSPYTCTSLQVENRSIYYPKQP